MRRRHVVVLFQHRLFGEAIARVLRENEQLRVTTLPIDALSPQALREISPDAIVLEEQPAPDDVKSALLDAAPALTVVVGPEANTAEVYQRHEVIQATATEIIARIMSGTSAAAARHTDTVRSPLPAPRENEP
jgi:hypothetical protein